MSLGNQEIYCYLRALNRNEEKNVLGLIFKPRQFCTWPIWPSLANTLTWPSLAKPASSDTTHFKQYCVLFPLWPSLANTLTLSSLAKSGQ